MTDPAASSRARRAGASRRERLRRSPGAVALSVVLHVGLAAVLMQALRVPAPFAQLFTRLRTPDVAERVTFVDPTARELPPPPAEGGGDGRPAAPASPRPAAPVTVPSAIPDPAPAPTPAPAPAAAADGSAPAATRGGAGVGELSGAGAGLRPTYTGPSAIWARPTWEHANPGTTAERLDSLVAVELADVRDSLLIEAQQRKPGDWTFERNGQTYGMDQRYLHLGKVKIPTALLGLVPLRQQANPIARDRERQSQALGAESRAQGRRRRDDVDVSARIAEIRARKDRERAEARARAGGSGGRGGNTSPP